LELFLFGELHKPGGGLSEQAETAFKLAR